MNSSVQQVDYAFYYIIGIAILLLALITGAMIYFAIRYREQNHPNPKDIRGNLLLEIIWMVVPTIIAVSMFVVGWSAYTGLRNVPEGAIEINVYAQMYSWIFVYPNEKETENELVVPVGKPIKLNITSEDVLHGLFIPAYRIKVDAVNGMTTYAWFQAEKTGEHTVKCTEFCGVGHADMTAKLRVVPEEEYMKWLASDENE